MNKSKKKAIILGIICFVILIGAFIGDRLLSKSYLQEIKYSDVMKKVENKESFILLLSQTTCTHCMDFKPKLKKVANKYKITVYYLEKKTAATRIDGDVSEEKIISKFKSNGYIE